MWARISARWESYSPTDEISTKNGTSTATGGMKRVNSSRYAIHLPPLMSSRTSPYAAIEPAAIEISVARVVTNRLFATYFANPRSLNTSPKLRRVGVNAQLIRNSSCCVTSEAPQQPTGSETGRREPAPPRRQR